MTAPLVKAHGRLAETEIDDEIVVMHLDSGDFFSLTGPARAIWELIDGTRDAAAIAAVLGARHPAERAAIAQDVPSFLAELAAAGLIAHE